MKTPLPDLLPARMLNEFIYCPRLFYYEWVEGLFAESADTVEGSARHAKIEGAKPSLPSPEAAEAAETIHGRSATLSAPSCGLIAKLDLLEGEGGCVTPVDYKRGAPREKDGEIVPWDADRIQLGAQALVLRENGYRCEEGVLSYGATKQRVRVPIDETLLAEVRAAVARAKAAAAGEIPPPLADSPKCPRCSLAGICLPDETLWSSEVAFGEEPPAEIQLEFFPRARALSKPPRRLIPARDDLRPLYLNTQGARVGRSGDVLQVKEREKLLHEVRLGEVSQVNLFGNIQITSQSIQRLCAEEIPVAWFSQGGWFYGVTHGLGLRNIFLRREQFRHADFPWFCVRFAREIVAGKIQNQRTLLQRNHLEPPPRALADLRALAEQARAADALDRLLGIEGNASRIYFEHFAGMLKAGEELAADAPKGTLRFDFTTRNRRPPRDPINALLSLAYAVLAKDLTVTCCAVGFDPYLGFYHQPRFGRPALALDLMEPFRPLIADSAVLTAVNTRMVTTKDFLTAGGAVSLTPEGRKAFFRAYEQRMDTLVTHPIFGYRISYRRILEVQTRLLARWLNRELANYSAFVTR